MIFTICFTVLLQRLALAATAAGLNNGATINHCAYSFEKIRSLMPNQMVEKDDESQLARQYFCKFYPKLAAGEDDIRYHSDLSKNSPEKDAVMEMQKNFGLPATGVIDEETCKAIHAPRCGVPDRSVNGRNIALDMNNYGHPTNIDDFPGRRFKEQNLTYVVNPHPSMGITKEKLSNLASKAFQIWSKEIPLNFREVESEADATIKIKFFAPEEPEKHSESKWLPNELAHAYYPDNTNGDLRGEIHFNLNHTWRFGYNQGKHHLLETLTHEIGHAIGFEHIYHPSSLMYPPYIGMNPVKLGIPTLKTAAKHYGLRGCLSKWFYGARLRFEWKCAHDIGSDVWRNSQAKINEYTLPVYNTEGSRNRKGCLGSDRLFRWGLFGSEAKSALITMVYFEGTEKTPTRETWITAKYNQYMNVKGQYGKFFTEFKHSTLYHMQWMIEVPNNSPNEMKKIQFCVRWSSRGNIRTGLSCVDEAKNDRGTICVYANQFTPKLIVYSNETNRGCDLSWAIFSPRNVPKCSSKWEPRNAGVTTIAENITKPCTFLLSIITAWITLKILT